MKVKIDGKTYCVETLIFDNQRLREEVVAGAKLHRLILDEIRTEIEEHAKINQNLNTDRARALCWCLDVIDKYKTESEG